MDNIDIPKLQLDYQHTIDQFKMLAEIRFKLLAFVPTLAGAAIAFFTETREPVTALAIGILGFVMTIGITFYDIRNTQLYDAAIHRAKWLEALLDLPICTQREVISGGLFNEKPRHRLSFLGLFEIWHDRGLSLAYGAALGGWSYVIANSSLSLVQCFDHRLALVIAAIIGILCAWEYERLSKIINLPPNEELEIVIKNRKGMTDS
jgi:hypothetical protein